MQSIRHICLADDDPDDYYLFYKALKEVNEEIEFTWCNTCEKLLAFLTSTPSLPDLILLDWNMPRTDGPSCLKKIKGEEILTKIPVVIFSTASSPTNVETALSFGAQQYVVKPFSIADLKKIIQQLILQNKPQ